MCRLKINVSVPFFKKSIIVRSKLVSGNFFKDVVFIISTHTVQSKNANLSICNHVAFLRQANICMEYIVMKVLKIF